MLLLCEVQSPSALLLGIWRAMQDMWRLWGGTGFSKAVVGADSELPTTGFLLAQDFFTPSSLPLPRTIQLLVRMLRYIYYPQSCERPLPLVEAAHGASVCSLPGSVLAETLFLGEPCSFWVDVHLALAAQC